LLWNQLGRFSFSPKSGKTDTLSRDSKSSPTPVTRQCGSDAVNRVSDVVTIIDSFELN
jgi:hypothetical protein